MPEELFKKMAQSIIDGDSDASTALAKESITVGIPPLQAITDGFVIGVNTVGDAFGRGNVINDRVEKQQEFKVNHDHQHDTHDEVDFTL